MLWFFCSSQIINVGLISSGLNLWTIVFKGINCDISYLDFEHHVDPLLWGPSWRACYWWGCLPTGALAPPQVDQVRLLVTQKVHKQLVLQGGERDLDGGPGQVAGVVEGGRFVDLFFRLVTSLLDNSFRWLLRFLLVPYLCLLVGLGSLWCYLCLIYLNDIHFTRYRGKGWYGED